MYDRQSWSALAEVRSTRWPENAAGSAVVARSNSRSVLYLCHHRTRFSRVRTRTHTRPTAHIAWIVCRTVFVNRVVFPRNGYNVMGDTSDLELYTRLAKIITRETRHGRHPVTY